MSSNIQVHMHLPGCLGERSAKENEAVGTHGFVDPVLVHWILWKILFRKQDLDYF